MTATLYKGLVVEGEVHIDPWDISGNKTGYLDPINTTKLAIAQPNPDTKTRLSNKRGSIGQLLGTVYTPKPVELSMDIDDQPYEILQMAFMGTSSTYAQTASTTTSEAVTLIPGRWVPLAKRAVVSTGINVSKASTPLVPMTQGTDYEVDLIKGLIRAIVGGSLTVATPCLVDYGWGTLSGTIITASVRTVIQCSILLEGVNSDNGKHCTLEIFEANLYQNGDIDVAKRDFITTSLKGLMIAPVGKPAPYQYKEY